MAYRILLSTTVEKTLPLGRALKDIGYDVFVFDATIRSNIDRYFFRPVNKTLWNLRLMDKTKSVGTESIYCNKNYRTHSVLKAAEEFRPDCIFFEIGFKPSYEGLAELREKTGKIAGWWTMTTNWINIEERERGMYDAFFFFSREFVPMAERLGFNAFYLPHAVNDYIFRKLELTPFEKKSWDCDLSFVGAWQRPRQQVIEAIAESGLNARIYGPKWIKHSLNNPKVLRAIKGKWIFDEDLVRLYNASRIVLNINSWFMKKTYGINQRVFDVPACSAFLLTDYVNELEAFFRNGEEIETYKSIEEMMDKIAFYTRNDSVRQKIAAKGYERSKKLPTWRDRAREMAEALGLPPPGKA